MADLQKHLVSIEFNPITGAEEVISTINKVNEKLTSINKIYEVLPDGSKALKGVQENFKPVVEGATQGHKKTNDFVNALRRAAIVAPIWMAARAAMQMVFSLIRDQIKFLKDMELAMARIQIVGKGTAVEYNNLKISLLALSVAYGVSASKALDAAQIFAQQGRTVSETFKLTRIAMAASIVLGEDIKDSVNNITAAIEGFNIPVEDSITIIDKWINVEKNFAVTSKDLAEATKAAGATANQLGVSIDSFLGDITAMIEVTRKSGSQTGNALQFIYARVFTTGKQALETIAKIPLFLDKGGVAVTRNTGVYRNLEDVLGDLANKWDTLTEKNKLDIAQGIASKRQLVSFMALMQNYNTALEARISSLSSAGTAENAFGIMQETVTIKLEKLTSSWNLLTSVLADTGAWKVSLDSANALLEVITELVNKSQALSIAANKQADKNLKVIETEKSSVKNLKELIDMRNKYLTNLPSDKNSAMLEKINKAIESTSGKLSLSIDINAPDFKERLDKIIAVAEKREVNISISKDFDARISQLRTQIKELKSDLKETTLPGLKLSDSQLGKTLEIKAMEQEILQIRKDKVTAIEAEINLLEVNKQKKEDLSNWEKIELNAAGELLDSEKEKIDIQQKLNIAKSSGLFNARQLLDIEIDLVKNSVELYDQHDKNLKLYELESQKSETILENFKQKLSDQSKLAQFIGYEESAIIRQEIALKTLMSGEDYLKNSFDDRLRLAQALSKEMDEQNKKSSHMVELYKIAKRYGVGTAQEVAQFKGGAISASQVSQGTLNILRRADRGTFDQIQAEKFFQGTGFKFPEEIEKTRRQQRNIQILNQVGIEPIEINVNIDTEDILNRIKTTISAEIDRVGSELNKSIHNQIEQH